VTRRRRLASEKESWWGCRFSISSAITSPESWPATAHESGEGVGEGGGDISGRYQWKGEDS